MSEYNVNLSWDNDAAVWIATSEDIPGLVLESDSFDVLIERVKHAAPELLELNNAKQGNQIRLCFRVERYEVLIA